MRTTDGGLNWTDVSPPSVRGRTNKNEEFFLDASHAWVVETVTTSSACIDSVVVFRTADGGRTWQQQDNPPLPIWPTTPPTDVLWTGSNNHAQLLDFSDPQNGWLLLGTGPPTTAPTGAEASWIGSTWRTGSLWNTNDGGATWAVAPNPFGPVGCVPSTSGSRAKSNMSFSSPSDGWLLAACEGSADPANLLVTHNAGLTWSRATTPLAPEEAPVFFDSRHAVALATGGLVVTSDGGLTWSVRLNPGSYGVDFINKNDAWSVGAGNNNVQCSALNDKACNGNFRLYYTNDGGVSWTPGAFTGLAMPAPKWWPLAYLHFVDSKNGFLSVGEDANEQGLFRTSDGGATWTRVNGTVEGS